MGKQLCALFQTDLSLFQTDAGTISRDTTEETLSFQQPPSLADRLQQYVSANLPGQKPKVPSPAVNTGEKLDASAPPACSKVGVNCQPKCLYSLLLACLSFVVRFSSTHAYNTEKESIQQNGHFKRHTRSPSGCKLRDPLVK